MPKYLDHHRAVAMDPKVMQQVISSIKSGQAINGVKPLNGFAAKDEAWCLCEAPNADAVRKVHEAYGLKGTEVSVTEVQTFV
jgi:hypothetical protein